MQRRDILLMTELNYGINTGLWGIRCAFVHLEIYIVLKLTGHVHILNIKVSLIVIGSLAWVASCISRNYSHFFYRLT